MSAADVIAEALRGCGLEDMAEPSEILASLKTAGYAVVELPKPCAIPRHWSEDCIGAWQPDGGGDPISAWPDPRPYAKPVALPNAEFVSLDRARTVAAALLAAIDAVEANA